MLGFCFVLILTLSPVARQRKRPTTNRLLHRYDARVRATVKGSACRNSCPRCQFFVLLLILPAHTFTGCPSLGWPWCCGVAVYVQRQLRLRW